MGGLDEEGRGREGHWEAGMAHKWVGTVKTKHRISSPSDLFQLADETQQRGLQKEKAHSFLTHGSTVEHWCKLKSFVSGPKQQTGPTLPVSCGNK